MSSAERSSNQSYLPFKDPLGRVIAKCLHSEVRELGEDWVVKRIRSFWKIGGWREKMVKDYRLLNQYLGDFIPSTSFIKCADANNKEELLMVQQKIKGKPLREHTMEELRAPAVLEQFDSFTRCIFEMYKVTGRMPDIHGDGLKLNHQYNVKHTDNVLIEPAGKVWLVDVGLGPLWSQNMFGKVHMKRMMGSLLDLRAQLGLEDLNSTGNS